MHSATTRKQEDKEELHFRLLLGPEWRMMQRGCPSLLTSVSITGEITGYVIGTGHFITRVLSLGCEEASKKNLSKI